MTTIWTKLLRENMGRTDQYLRVFVGAVLIGLAIMIPTAWGWIGIVPLVTGFVGSCPLYKLLGIQRHQNLGA